jgi:hypothetical protein
MNALDLFVTCACAVFFSLLILILSGDDTLSLGVLMGCVAGALTMGIHRMRNVEDL